MNNKTQKDKKLKAKQMCVQLSVVFILPKQRDKVRLCFKGQVMKNFLNTEEAAYAKD
jgi:hypothetical protein